MKLTQESIFNDNILSRRIDLNSQGMEIENLLMYVAKKTNVNFSVAEPINYRRCTVIGNSFLLSSFMRSLSKVLNSTWRKINKDGKNTYELFQTEAQKRSDDKSVYDSRQKEEEFRRIQRKAILDDYHRASSANSAHLKGLTDLLSTLSDKQLESVADSALEPPDIISASDQSHFHKHFFYPTLISSLNFTQ